MMVVGSRWYLRTLGVVVGVAGLLATLMVPAAAQSDSDDPFYSGPISGPDVCLAMSLGGPATFAFDSDGDGVADTCSLDRSRRETAARQQALERLGGEFGSELDRLFAEECERVAESFGEPEAEATDECARIAAGEDVSVVVPPLPEGDAYDLFFSGPVITGPSFCLNLSFGGPVTYPFDSDGDGIADVCSLPRSKRAAVARQRALESLSRQQSERFEALIAEECASVPETFGETDAEATDACEPIINPPEEEEPEDTGSGGGSGGGGGGGAPTLDLSEGLDIDLNFGNNNSLMLAPQNVVIAPGTGNLIVGWNAPTQSADEVFEYEVQYSVNPGFSDSDIAIMTLSEIEAPCRLATDSNRLAGETYQCTLDDLDNLTPYYVRVRALRGQGLPRPWTTSYTATPGQPVRPQWAATPLTYSTYGQMTARWLEPLGTTTTGYLIQWGTSSSFAEDCSTSDACSQEELDGSALTTVLPNLEYGQRYFARIKGTGTNDASGPWSRTVSLRKVSTLPAPAVPFVLSASTSATTTMTVFYEEAPGLGTHVVVQYRSLTDNEDWSTLRQGIIALGDSFTYDFTGLTTGDEYEVRIAAINGTRPSAWKAPPLRITLGEATTPSSLSTRTSADSGAIDVFWGEETTVPAITSVTLQWSTTSSFPADCATATTCDSTSVTAGNNFHTITGLTNGTTYYLRAQAVNSNGGGPWTRTVSFVPGIYTAPGLAESGDGATVPLADTPDGMILRINAPEETGKGAITGFDFRFRSPPALGSWSNRYVAVADMQTASPGETAFTHWNYFGGLPINNVQTEVHVRTINSAGKSEWVAITIQPSYWWNLVAFGANTSNNNLTLNWSYRPGDGVFTGDTVESLTIQLRDCGPSNSNCGAWGNTKTFTGKSTVQSTTSTQYASSELTNGNIYEARIRLNGQDTSLHGDPVPDGPWQTLKNIPVNFS